MTRTFQRRQRTCLAVWLQLMASCRYSSDLDTTQIGCTVDTTSTDTRYIGSISLLVRVLAAALLYKPNRSHWLYNYKE